MKKNIKIKAEKLINMIKEHKRDIAVAAGTVGVIMLKNIIKERFLIDHDAYKLEVGWSLGGGEIGFRTIKRTIFGKEIPEKYIFYRVEEMPNCIEIMEKALREAKGLNI